MTPEIEIKAALIRLHDGIKRADAAVVSESLRTLDELFAAHRDAINPRLAHFVEGRSYAKALAWLGGPSEADPSTPPGGCSRRVAIEDPQPGDRGRAFTA